MVFMKYNYIVFGTTEDYYRLGYMDLNNGESDTHYFDYPRITRFPSKLLSFIRKVHMSPRVNGIVKLPGKSVWNRLLYKDQFCNGKPTCFIFFSSGPFTEHLQSGFQKYLKNHYPGSKFVVFYQDLVEARSRTNSIEYYKETFDELLSFDFGDCQKYGMHYHPLVFSDIRKIDLRPVKKSDVYFCGAAKNRIDKILEAYDYFSSCGYDCDFIIITDKEEDIGKCKKRKGIRTCKALSYYDNLAHVASTKYLLEIMQKGGTGFTIRICEAIAFNKKLISNNAYLKRAAFYNVEDVIAFDTIEDLSKKTLDFERESSLKKYREDISPLRLIDYIERIINT